MSATQLQGALGLLKKCVPDLKSTEMDIKADIGVREIVKEYVDDGDSE